MLKILGLLFATSIICSNFNQVQNDSGEYILVIHNKENKLFKFVMSESIDEKNISATLSIHRKKYLQTKKIDMDSIITFEPPDPKTYEFYSLKEPKFSKKINSNIKRTDITSISNDEIKYINTLYLYVKQDMGYLIYDMKLRKVE
ncbi:hypothetical protein [uncultured Roseivirga sp.]|uniref:hypothetical protein n=1 Tax=uncultured Roseivirga sp. TaxID=543088 RepID=UPI002583BEEF|nr:hypothetical protein [uncultured Roseivirga sp.]